MIIFTKTGSGQTQGKLKKTDAFLQAIMLELMVNGPSGNQMTVYGDFGSYKGGVYYTECGKKPPLGAGTALLQGSHFPFRKI